MNKVIKVVFIALGICFLTGGMIRYIDNKSPAIDSINAEKFFLENRKAFIENEDKEKIEEESINRETIVKPEAKETIYCRHNSEIMPKYVFPDICTLEELNMPYRLFIAMNMLHIDGGLIYWDYGIVDETHSTWEKAVERYSQEMQEVLGYPEEIIWGNTDNDHNRRIERENKERIVDISEDGRFHMTYEYEYFGNEHVIKLYDKKKLISQFQGIDYSGYHERVPVKPFGKIISSDFILYDLIAKTEFKTNQNGFGCLNEDGLLLARCEGETEVFIYDLTNNQCIFNFRQVTRADKNSYLRLCQFRGNQKEGYLILEDESGSYKLHYPSGELELLGNYMFNPSLSPDENYLMYTGINYGTWENLGWKSDNESYYNIPAGIYIKEINTGKVAYIALDEEPRVMDFLVRWLDE